MSGLKEAFLGMKEAQEERISRRQEPPAEIRERILEATKKSWAERDAGKIAGPTTKVGKSANPEFEPVKIYLRKQTHKAARRRCEDAGEGDFSELIEQLLQEYLGA